MYEEIHEVRIRVIALLRLLLQATCEHSLLGRLNLGDECKVGLVELVQERYV